MTKREIFERESCNRGVVVLYPEGKFYKAYERSAWLLCMRGRAPLKVSARSFSALPEPLVSVGFPQESLGKFAAGLRVSDDPSVPGGKVLAGFGEELDFSGFAAWKQEQEPPAPRAEKRFRLDDALPVYGLAYRMSLELTRLCAGLSRDYRYSLGEQLRGAMMRALVCISLAWRKDQRLQRIVAAREAMEEVQLCLRHLSDLRLLKDTRYVGFIDMSESVNTQLEKWERSERTSVKSARVPSSPVGTAACGE